MDGPEHYREAERLLGLADDRRLFDTDNQGAAVFTQQALVHATLALAAAQVEDMESTELRPGWAAIVDGDD